MKRKLCALISSVLALTMTFATPVSAAPPSSSGDGYITFVQSNPNERIETNGDFTFEVAYELVSLPFKVTSSRVEITITTSTVSNKDFKVLLVEDNDDVLFPQTVSKTFKDSGAAQKQTYTGLSTNKRYYLEIIVPNGTPRVKGVGHISNYEAIF